MKALLLLLLIPLAVTGPALHAQAFGLRVGAAAQPARRLAVTGAEGGTATGTVGEVELGLRAGPIRVELRSGSGEFTADSGAFGAGTVTTGLGTISAGGKSFWAGAGIGRRAYSGTLARRVWQFTEIHGGVAFEVIGPLRGEVEGGVYLSAKEMEGPTEASGRFAEASLLFEPTRIPVYLRLGFRAETFNPKSGSESAPDEISGMIVGGGVRIGR